MNNPLVSIIVTTFNLEDYIEDTLKTVLSQKTDFDFEVIVGDDGSSDKTISIIEKLEENYSNVLSHYIMPRESGVDYNPIKRASENRLEGQRRSKGKYITFLDGDDYYIDDRRTQKLVDILESVDNSDCSIVATNMNIEDCVNGERSLRPILPTCLLQRKFKQKEYWEQYWIHAEACLFRNIDIHLEDNPLYFFDDNLIVFYYLKYGKMYYIPDLTANYRRHNTPYYRLKELERQWVNYLDCEAEKRYNPKIRFASNCRHAGQFVYCLKNINQLGEIVSGYTDVINSRKPYMCAYCFIKYSNNKQIHGVYLFLYFFYLKIVLYWLSCKRLVRAINSLFIKQK